MLKRKLVFCITMSAFSLSFNACASIIGGMLSDAMDAASDDDDDHTITVTIGDEDDEELDDGDLGWDNEEDARECERRHNPDDDVRIEGNLGKVFSSTEDSTSEIRLKIPLSLEFAGGSGIVYNKDLFGYNHFTMTIAPFFKSGLYLSTGLAQSPVQKTGHLASSLKNNVYMFNIGVGYRFYTTPSHTFLGNYLAIGANYTLMAWRYKNSIYVETYDDDGVLLEKDEVFADALDGLELYCATGINLIQTKHFKIGGTITPGVILWYGTTMEGFTNDVFKPFGYLKFGINIQMNSEPK